MSINVGYVARETGSNLRRNLSLTLASMLTVAVSLSLFGAAVLIAQGVGNMTARWQGGIEFIVFMNPNATQEQLNGVRTALDANPEVASVDYVDKEAAYEEFKELFSRSKEMVEAVDAEAMPPGWHPFAPPSATPSPAASDSRTRWRWTSSRSGCPPATGFFSAPTA